MTVDILNLGDIRYNPEQAAFETLVRILDDGDVFSYPVQLRAPLQADFDIIAHGLTQKARHAHEAPISGMRMVGAAMPAMTDIRAACGRSMAA